MIRTACLVLFALLTVPAGAEPAPPLAVEEVVSVAALPVTQPAVATIAFSDHHRDRLADPVSGLLRFADWAQAKPVQKQFLGLYPSYDEPTVTIAGKPRKKRMHVYVAEARFRLDKPVAGLDPARLISIAALERLDPAIKHRKITADDVIPGKGGQPSNNVDPQRRWCASPTSLCIQSYYKLEGKLPAGVQLVNKLREGHRKIADFIEFQSELRFVPESEIDSVALSKLTGVAGPVAAVLEQNIFWVNQVMQFGKFMVVFQADPAAPDKTIASAFMALGVESELMEKKKEYGQVPVLRNLIPAQVLAGNSSFNTGASISAGLPKYVRNSIRAFAALVEKP
jgi:hypothetical protein